MKIITRTVGARAWVALALLFLQASPVSAHHVGASDEIDENRSTEVSSSEADNIETGSQEQFERFVPRDATLSAKVDYTWWNTRMRHLVLSMRPSTRSRLSRPQRTTGSQIL